jgi:enoyl-CoA hydratase
MADAVTLEHRHDIAVINIDDGKANALSASVIAAIGEALDSLDASTRAVVLAGRPGMLSGGFDLSVMRGTDLAAIANLVTDGGELVLRLYRSERPVVAACTGHAIAAGALLLLGSHFRVGADGAFKIGLTETAIGMVLPDWGVEAAIERLAPGQLQQAAVEAHVYDPRSAWAAGFLDRVVPEGEVTAAALEEAARLAAFSPQAYAGNAAKVRQRGVDRLAAAVARDRAAIAALGAAVVEPS